MKLRDTASHDLTYAIIYCRVSSSAQVRRGDGLGSQETRCRSYAEFKRYLVENVFTDDLTGTTSDRAGFKRLLEFLHAQKKEGKRFVVIVDDLNRIARRVEVHIEIRKAIVAAGGILETPSLELRDDADSELQEYLMATVAQHQSRKNQEQTINRMHSRMVAGLWVLPSPVGYKYELKAGRGKVLVRDEPEASIIQEALEGFASGRFQTQVEVKRFLEMHTGIFARDAKGKIVHQRIKDILTRKIYSGYVEYERWGISLRKGQHEGLISLKTYERIQERLKEKSKIAARKDLHADFPLRGFVSCAECDKPLTAAWSTSKTGKNHPYYMCFNKACNANRKSIRRDDVHNSFESILKTMQPTTAFSKLVRAMFEKAWKIRLEQSKQRKQALIAEIKQLDAQSTKLIDTIIDETDEDLIVEMKRRLSDKKKQKALAQEKVDNFGMPKHTFSQMFELSMIFLSNPWKIWENGDMALKRTVLKLGFSEKLAYHRKKGFRTPKTTLPFKYLGGLNMLKNEMARPGGFEPPTS